METLNNPGAPPAMSRAQLMRAAARFSYTAASGERYQLQRATGLSMVAAGLPPEFFVQFVVDKPEPAPGATAAELEAAEAKRVTEDPGLMATLFGFMGGILAAHLVEPRLFAGHPADCPDGAVTLGDLPENDALELFQVLTSCVLEKEGRAAMQAVASFRPGTSGAAVPRDVPPVQPEPGAPAAG